MTPVALAVGATGFTVAAAATGLPEPLLNYVAIPAVGIPAGFAGILVAYWLGPALARRFPAHPLLVMAAVRWLATLVCVTLAVWLLAPFLVGRAWWPWLPVLLPPVGAGVGAVFLLLLLLYDRVYFRLQAAFAELDRRRELERFLPAEAVERVLSGNRLALGGERRVATILFADLRDSTSLAEALPAEAVVQLLNTYVGALGRCVFEEGGMLDKFLGDGLMAVFGVMDPEPALGAEAATRAALAMRQRIGALNAQRVAGGLPPVGFGVGIHTGEVILGAVGIPERMDFTALGDTVNTASRVEGLCKEFRVDVVLTAATVAYLDSAALPTRPLGPAAVRGKSAAIQVATLA